MFWLISDHNTNLLDIIVLTWKFIFRKNITQHFFFTKKPLSRFTLNFGVNGDSRDFGAFMFKIDKGYLNTPFIPTFCTFFLYKTAKIMALHILIDKIWGHLFNYSWRMRIGKLYTAPPGYQRHLFIFTFTGMYLDYVRLTWISLRNIYKTLKYTILRLFDPLKKFKCMFPRL